MANRVTVPVTNFESLSPPWSLTSLDSDLLALQGALNDSSLGYVISGPDTGSANNYVVATPSFGTPSAYQVGMTVAFIPANTNTAASTLTVSALSPQAIMVGSSPLPPGALTAGYPVLLTYMGASFRLLAPTTPVVNVVSNPGTGTTVTTNCAGASAVLVYVNWTIAANNTITLQNLALGIPVTVALVNSSAGTVNYSILATNTVGTSITTYGLFATSPAGSTIYTLSSSYAIAAGGAVGYTGMATNGSLFLTS